MQGDCYPTPQNLSESLYLFLTFLPSHTWAIQWGLHLCCLGSRDVQQLHDHTFVLVSMTRGARCCVSVFRIKINGVNHCQESKQLLLFGYDYFHVKWVDTRLLLLLKQFCDIQWLKPTPFPVCDADAPTHLKLAAEQLNCLASKLFIGPRKSHSKKSILIRRLKCSKELPYDHLSFLPCFRELKTRNNNLLC